MPDSLPPSNPRQPSSTPSPKRFLIACGGTGGHLFPGISIAQELRRRGHVVRLIISPKAIDRRALEAHPELESQPIALSPMPRPLSLAMPRFLLQFTRSLLAARRLIRTFHADAVLGMGGFTSLPPLLAARHLGVPAFIHESNAIPGKANRWAARYCTAVFLGTPACQPHFPKSHTHLTGTPVRDELKLPVDPAQARASFNLRPHTFTLLVMGGSQGAQGLNRAAVNALSHLDPQSIQFLHLTGPEDEASTREAYTHAGFTHHVAAFCDRMREALAASDAALCRSGASSMSELAHFGIPPILVPYPFAAEDHQTHNAQPLADAGAAILCPQKDLSGEKLAGLLQSNFLPPEKRAAMEKNLQAFRSDDANIKICDIMEAHTA